MECHYIQGQTQSHTIGSSETQIQAEILTFVLYEESHVNSERTCKLYTQTHGVCARNECTDPGVVKLQCYSPSYHATQNFFCNPFHCEIIYTVFDKCMWYTKCSDITLIFRSTSRTDMYTDQSLTTFLNG